MKVKNKSTVNLEISLVEIILSIFIFAAAVVIILNCFAIAKFTEEKSNDKTKASFKAQSAFEYIKSAKNSKEMHDILQNNFLYEETVKNQSSFIYTVYYDKSFIECSKESYEFKMIINTQTIKTNSGQLTNATIDVEKKDKYPFLKNDDKKVYSISSKKFFPMHVGGVQ